MDLKRQTQTVLADGPAIDVRSISNQRPRPPRQDLAALWPDSPSRPEDTEPDGMAVGCPEHHGQRLLHPADPGHFQVE